MKETVAAALDGLKSKDAESQNRAYTALLAASAEPVDWAYEIWDDLLRLLKNGDNRQRSIASQVLCQLAKSDPQGRVLKDFGALLEVTKDERFVTARHCLQSLWRVGILGPKHKEKYVKGLQGRFAECKGERNGTLIRYDILVSLRRVYDNSPDEKLRAAAMALIETETDAKYKKKYMTVWRK